MLLWEWWSEWEEQNEDKFAADLEPEINYWSIDYSRIREFFYTLIVQGTNFDDDLILGVIKYKKGSSYWILLSIPLSIDNIIERVRPAHEFPNKLPSLFIRTFIDFFSFHDLSWIPLLF